MDTKNYGVCRLSVISVRAQASDKAEQVTQLLFGDHYEITETSADKKWLKVQIFADQYEGWINYLQHHEISAEYFDYLSQSDLKITTDLTSSILFNKVSLVILIGSTIPISGSELFRMEEQFAFNGESKNAGLKRGFDFLSAIAQKFLYVPYQWGGKSPFGIDCSGFTQVVFKICGYALLRDAHQQARQGKAVPGFGDAKPGDLVFFKNDEGNINHVGMLTHENKIIHASGRVRIDMVSENGIQNVDTKTITHRFSHLRRILQEPG